MVFHDHLARIRHPANLGGGQIPFVKNTPHLFLAALLHDDEHALLRLAQQNLVGRHARAALRHLGQVNLNAGAAPRGGFAGGTSEAGGAHVLNTRHGSGGQQLEAGFHAKLFHEGIAHLHGAALLFGRFLGEILRGKGRAREAVAAGGRAHVIHGIAHAGSRPTRNLIMAQHPHRKGVDQRIALVAFVKIHFARHRRNTEAISVMRNAADHTAEEPAHGAIV